MARSNTNPHPLRTWRKSRGLILATVAEAAKVTPTFLSEIEKGNKQPSLATADRIVQATVKLDKAGDGVSLDAFVRREAAE